MDMEQVRIIVAQAGKWAAGIIGAVGGVAGIVKIISTLINSKARKNPVSLTAADRKEIAHLAASEVVASTQQGVAFDIDAQIDKATNKRLAAMEKRFNGFVWLIKRLIKGQKTVMKSLSEFKTISNDSRIALLAEVDTVEEDEKDLGLIAEQPKIEVKIEPKQEVAPTVTAERY